MVPLYQRSYAWDQLQLQDYQVDLRNAFNAQKKEHFLGTVVLSQEDGGTRHVVIDGQQRLATSVLFFCAIRDYYRSHGEGNRADFINSEYLNSYDDGADAYEPRLKLNAEDDEFFRQFVVEQPGTVSSSRESHELIAKAYASLAAFVDGEAASAGTSWIDRLVEWRRFLVEDVRVIYVSVASESDAFLIFETLNDRGADLTLADLLKNYLFGLASKSENGLEQVRDRWLLALGALDTNQDVFVGFLRQLWSSKRGITRERVLYKQIKSEITSSVKAIQFATEIHQASVLYSGLLSSADGYWSGWGTATRTNIATLNRLGLGQNRPMLLAALQYFPQSEAKKVLRLAVNWGVRSLIVGGAGGGSTEKAYCDAAVAIRTGRVKSTDELLGVLDDVVASDEEFAAAFARARVAVQKSYLSRYYLLALEKGLAGEAQPELVPNDDESQVNLEHIYPKSPRADDWGAFSDEPHAVWRDRLGNHALLGESANGSVGNVSFEDKKPVFAESAILLTKELASYEVWTPVDIQTRQERLAALAVSVWPRAIS